jgi:hypothetical protein
MNMKDFTDQEQIKFSVIEVSTRPDGLMGDSSFHFHCRLRNNGHTMGLYFSMGSAHAGKYPELTEVLDCLASDAVSYEQAGAFEDWAEDFGYSSDSRAAEKIYRVVRRQAQQLKRLLGLAAYEQLLYSVERL